MIDVPTVWMRPPFGQGEPKEVDATPDILIPMMVAGWAQCGRPMNHQEVNANVSD
jgi:hypothetical protein